MKEVKSFAVLRGDRRQNLLCDLLQADGHRAQLLPEPEKWHEENLPPPGSLLIVAKASPALRAAGEEVGFSLMEYGTLPSFMAENGAITAENALQTAMKHRLRTLRGSDVLVIGWGNIGKPLAALLQAVGAGSVGVAVRREGQLWALQAQGCRPTRSRDLAREVGGYDLIFNTAPELLLTRPVLEMMQPHALVVDLASKPGGVDYEAARDVGIKAVQALGLPGLMTPVSAAIAIRNAVYEICREECK